MLEQLCLQYYHLLGKASLRTKAMMLNSMIEGIEILSIMVSCPHHSRARHLPAFAERLEVSIRPFSTCINATVNA